MAHATTIPQSLDKRRNERQAVEDPDSPLFQMFSVHTLRHWRLAGGGPCYQKIGSRIFYSDSDLREWIEGHKKLTSTSEAA